jgi:hypothetical protein
MCRAVAQGFYLDVPRVIDYAWRHAEYLLNAECDHTPGWIGPAGTPRMHARMTRRRFYRKPAFWFFAITIFFASYGPTWDGLCAIAPQSITSFLRQALAILLAEGWVMFVGLGLEWRVRFLIRERFEEVRRNEGPQALSFCRRATCCGVIYAGLILLAAIGFAGGVFLYHAAPGGLVCTLDEWNLTAIGRFAMCIAAVILFGWITSSDRAYGCFRRRTPLRWTRVGFAVFAQFLILLLVALIQWFGLSTAKTVAASDLPYRHFFLVWVPCIAAVIAVAPWWARSRFRSTTAQTRDHFRRLLRTKELFVQPRDPVLSARSIVYASVFGPVTHILHLLLFPALIAVTVPADWLNLSVLVALLFSFLLVVWGNMSPRWHELNVYVERWFLRGTPLLISLFVMAIAILRLFRFDYISTLLDAIPFGMVFALVLMNYVLFWLAEYWMSRAVALELLGVLGAVVRETYIRYRPAFAQGAHLGVHVDVSERYLASHGTGRFVVLGNVLGATPCRAFQSYYLTETFALLDGEKDSKWVAEIVQRTGTYFVGLNAALLGVALVFGLCYVVENRETVIEPVVTESPAPPMPEQLVDLSSLLRQQSDSVRPALVVVGSGGGTRAALYTTSVLKGLHGLEVDKDIVLLSGVSGGGVALAYFAANSDALTGRPAATRLCPRNKGAAPTVEDEWNCFTSNVTKPFIEDVVNGATEWRIFTNTALSALLAESNAICSTGGALERFAIRGSSSTRPLSAIPPPNRPCSRKPSTTPGHARTPSRCSS